MRNRFISLTRSFWYGLTEPIKLRLLRKPCPQANPPISVVVPTFNRKTLLIERCLKSVLAQTYKNFEVIVVAHGCTDGTTLAVRTYLPDPRIKVISIPRTETYLPTLENHWFAGRVVPANVGLAHIRGAWVATLDDDDIWFPDCLETLLRFAQTHDYEFVSAGSENQNGKIEPYIVDGVKIGGIGTWLYRGYLGSFRFNPDCWRKDHDRVCDTDLQARFRKAGARMGYLDKVVTKILPRPGENVVGLAAARQNKKSYMRHLKFN